MPPKKGGKKKGKKGKSGEKKKKEPTETITFNEAVMMYQLEVKEKEMNELKEDLEDLKFRNDRQKQRNQLLMKEQNQHVKTVLEQAHELARLEDKKEKVPYEDVEKALNEKLASIRIEENDIEQQKLKIDSFKREIEALCKSLEQAKDYKEHGQHVDRTHIEVLQKEMEDMKTSYAEISEFFEKSLLTVKNTIMKKNKENMDSQKKLASERAIKNLDKHTETEIVDNRWLHKEVEINRLHIAGVEKDIETLQQYNIAVMSELFEKQLYDVNETRKFYVACKEAEEDESSEEEDENTRAIANDTILKECTEETFAEDGEVQEVEEQPPDWLDYYLTEFDEKSNEDEYKLGPLAIKLLCVYGKKMELRKQDDGLDASGGKQFKKFSAERDEIVNVR